MKRTLITAVLEWPGGEWLVLLAGLVIVGVGLYQIYRAFSGQFYERVSCSHLPKSQQHVVYRAGQVGFTARGIVLAIIGYFLMQAGWQSRAGAMGNTDEAFDLLATMGPVVLGTVAAGLMAYGLFMLVQARYPVLRNCKRDDSASLAFILYCPGHVVAQVGIPLRQLPARGNGGPGNHALGIVAQQVGQHVVDELAAKVAAGVAGQLAGQVIHGHFGDVGRGASRAAPARRWRGCSRRPGRRWWCCAWWWAPSRSRRRSRRQWC